MPYSAYIYQETYEKVNLEAKCKQKSVEKKKKKKGNKSRIKSEGERCTT
jgi:hypothetical protein